MSDPPTVSGLNIDNLIESFNNSLNISETTPEIVENLVNNVDFTMTSGGENVTQAVNYQLLKLNIDTVASYDGNPETLEIFINGCDYLLRTFYDANNQNLNDYLIRVILSKLTGRAQIIIGARTELTRWDSIKDALRQNFGDNRDLDCAVQDLITASPLRNESPLEFGRRLQIIRSRVATKINALPNALMNLQAKLINLNQYDNLSLKTFIRGLTGQLQTVIRLRQPDSLETAMTYVTEEENFKYVQKNAPQSFNQKQTQFNQNPVQFNQSAQFSQPNVRPIQQNLRYQNQHPGIYNQTPQIYNQPRSFRQQIEPKPIWPSQPIQLQPRKIQPKKFFTNRQVFGPPQNVFKPNPNKTFERPTPMSTTSHQPNFRQNQNYNQNFRPQNQYQSNRPNFISEELFQINEQESDEAINPYSVDDYLEPDNADYAIEDNTLLERDNDPDYFDESENFCIQASTSIQT